MTDDPQSRGNANRRRAVSLIPSLAIVAIAAFAGSAAASEGCKVPMSPEYVDNIIADPEGELLRLRHDDLGFLYFFRSLSVNGDGALRAIGKMVPHTSLRQRGLIGQGMARAVAACNARYGETAAHIVDAVREIADRDVTRAFTQFLTDSSADAAAASDPGNTVAKTDEAKHRLRVGGLPDIMRPVDPLSPVFDDPFKLD